MIQFTWLQGSLQLIRLLRSLRLLRKLRKLRMLLLRLLIGVERRVRSLNWLRGDDDSALLKLLS